MPQPEFRPPAVGLLLASLPEPQPWRSPGIPPGTPPRLPGRHLRPLVGRPALSHLVERLQMARTVRQVVVTLSVAPEDDALAHTARHAGALVYRGSLHDITGRLCGCADWLRLPDEAPLVRVGADSLLIDPRYLDAGVQALLDTGAGVFEFLEDQSEELCPGLGAGFFRAGLLRHVDRRGQRPEHRGDPLAYAYEFPAEVGLVRRPLPDSLSYLRGRHRLLLQTAEDLAMLEVLYLRLHQCAPVDTAAAVRVLDNDPVLASLNQGVLRRSGTLPLPQLGWRVR
ncbi:MAG: hypothetical protein RMK29_13690 [Myxococcales bacterium]|nr:hypothetical protein [Myxococcota bacterium]MDW8282761.1 hypothetical protein [Myxococcales bacterium]